MQLQNSLMLEGGGVVKHNIERDSRKPTARSSPRKDRERIFKRERLRFSGKKWVNSYYLERIRERRRLDFEDPIVSSQSPA